MSIFGDLERTVADLYPYRWATTAGLVAMALVAAWIACRRGWHVIVWRHKAVSAVALAVALAVAVPAVDYFLSPLWERSHLEEASPLASASRQANASPAIDDVLPVADEEPAVELADPAPDRSADDTQSIPQSVAEPAFEPIVTHRGEVSGADDFHFGRGSALLIETAPDTYTLRFEDFSVRNGPDLFVYLTPHRDSVDGAINLGDLKATDGAFNYEVPTGTDAPQYRYAVVWCRQFSVLFASAPLDAAQT